MQVYINDERSRLLRPEKELVAFEKVFLEAGETKNVNFRLDKYAVGYYDTSLAKWIAEEGRFNLLIGASSSDIRFVEVPHQVNHLTGTDNELPLMSKRPLPGSFDPGLLPYAVDL